MAGRTMQHSQLEMLLQGRYLATERGWLICMLLCLPSLKLPASTPGKQLLKLGMLIALHRNI